MPTSEPTVYLIDSSIYVFHAWRMLPADITDTAGRPVNAVFGFADFLARLLEQTLPRYVVCAFDKSLGTSERKQIYPEYKANRPPAPAQLRHQFAVCQALAEHFGVVQFADARFEADDIIGTLAETVRRAGLYSTIVSADKDLMQFIEPGDIYWNYGRKLKMDACAIRKKTGIRPAQIADMLALCGDKVDNIPGIPGVGAATAARLLVKWGTLDTLFENVDEVASMKFRGAARVAELLQTHEHTVRLARRLTGLLQVDSLPDNIAALARTAVDIERLDSFLTTNGFGPERRQRLISLLTAGA